MLKSKKFLAMVILSLVSVFTIYSTKTNTFAKSEVVTQEKKPFKDEHGNPQIVDASNNPGTDIMVMNLNTDCDGHGGFYLFRFDNLQVLKNYIDKSLTVEVKDKDEMQTMLSEIKVSKSEDPRLYFTIPSCKFEPNVYQFDILDGNKNIVGTFKDVEIKRNNSNRNHTKDVIIFREDELFKKIEKHEQDELLKEKEAVKTATIEQQRQLEEKIHLKEKELLKQLKKDKEEELIKDNKICTNDLLYSYYCDKKEEWNLNIYINYVNDIIGTYGRQTANSRTSLLNGLDKIKIAVFEEDNLGKKICEKVANIEGIENISDVLNEEPKDGKRFKITINKNELDFSKEAQADTDKNSLWLKKKFIIEIMNNENKVIGFIPIILQRPKDV